MTLAYGFAKAKIAGKPQLKGSRRRHETQYHIHVSLDVAGQTWDTAINVGTDDADDLLHYRLVFDFHHPVIDALAASPAGKNDLTGSSALPALDFQRSDILKETGNWRPSDPMDGSEAPEPVASLLRLIRKAQEAGADVYLFGRFYAQGDGIHDTHMNQGSTGSFIHRPDDDSNDHNDIWQDGALLVALEEGKWAGYFSKFDQQNLPTDDLGNPSAQN